MTSFSSDQLSLMAGVIAVFTALTLARRVPGLRAVASFVSGTVFIGLFAFLLSERVQVDPSFGHVAALLHMGDDQRVEGDTTRLRMAPDGHFWVRANIGGAGGGVERRMLVDSGATVTALSVGTAAAAGVRTAPAPFPMLIRTANGTVRAETGTVPELRMGNIVARDLAVVVSPAFGDADVLGMNFLSRLKGWRVEDGTMILVPHHPLTAGAPEA